MDAHAEDVLARVDEFTDRGTPWHRALWLAGSILSVREIVEYGEQLQAKAISPDQVEDAAAVARKAVGRDVGINAAITKELDAILAIPKELAKEGARHRLAHLISRAEENYLSLWEIELNKPESDRPRAERVARHLTSHLLDSGVSFDQIASLVSAARLTDKPLGSLCSSASSLLSKGPSKFVVVVPLRELPTLFSKLQPGDSRQITVLATRADLQSASSCEWGEEYNSGLLISVRERDPWAATASTQELLTRLQARLSVSPSTDNLSLPTLVAVQGQTGLFPLQDDRRAIRVPALDRSRKTLQVGGYAEADALDDALELLATLGSGTPGAALTNGWASLEGLLVSVAEKGILAAERLADIITADWPRSELTWLANAPAVAEQTDPDLYATLRRRGVGTIKGKVEALERALRDGKSIAYSRPRDVAALHRLEALISDAPTTLETVRSGLLSALRRLYVQRNLVMHAGSFKSVARATALRTVPTIAAAGMDRLVHAADRGVNPLMLASRARAELDLLPSGGTGRLLGQLLD